MTMPPQYGQPIVQLAQIPIGNLYVAGQAQGDVIYYDAVTAQWVRLPVGIAGQVLEIVGGLPVWTTPTGGVVVATGAELDTGTDNAKFASAKALKDSHNVPSVVPSTAGKVLTSNGTDWISAVPAGAISLALADDVFGTFGTGGTASLGWETADANANALLLALPVSDGTDIPALVIGDANLINVNLGLLDTFTFPSISVIDTDRDSYLTLSYSADDVPIIASNRAIVLRPSGDLDDYFTFSTLTDVPTIFGTGAYTRFGDAYFTNHTLASEDDVMVSGKLEVSSTTYFDSTMYIGGSVYYGVNTLYLSDVATGTKSAIKFDTTDTDSLHLEIRLPTGTGNYIPLLLIEDIGLGGSNWILFDGITQPLVTIIEKNGRLLSASDGVADAGAATAILKHVGGFTAAVVGDIVRITAGTLCTAGWYWITTVTSADQVTLDRNYTSGNTTNVTFVTYHNFPMLGADGVCLKCFDGAPGDANVEIDRDGWLELDVSQANGRLYWRANNAWHYVDATAGFSFLYEEPTTFGDFNDWEVGDMMVLKVDRYAEDGGHALPYPLVEGLRETLLKLLDVDAEFRQQVKEKLYV